MRGQVCMVTGATSGIGEFTALGLARKQATVVIVGRNKNRCINAVTRIREATNNPNIGYLVSDLSSQAQIRRIVNEFKEQYSGLDVLVNNVGAAFWRRELSVDGIEMTLALNHLSYFLITNLLLNELLNSCSARVVNVTSGNHYKRRLDFDNLQLNKGYNPLKAYGRSKLANILFTYELDRRLGGIAVTANAMNPSRVSTNIWKNAGPIIGPLIGWFMSRNAQKPEEGAQAVIYLASSPEVEDVSGKYFRKEVLMDSDPETYNLESAKRLWEISAEMTGIV